MPGVHLRNMALVTRQPQPRHCSKPQQPMSTPMLYIFAISHYCEKARWALDYLNIDYETGYLPPGIHRRIASRLGAPRSSLPILAVDGQVVQGSAEIVAWADDTASTDAMCLTPDHARKQCLKIEKRLDEIAGVHIRRYYYSEALVEYPETVRPIFTKDLAAKDRMLTEASWNVVRERMIELMDLGPEQGRDSKHIVDGELRWIDEMLSDGRRFLVADQFTRADVAAASLLAPLAMPKEHRAYANLTLPPHMTADVERWTNRPSLQWVREVYARYR